MLLNSIIVTIDKFVQIQNFDFLKKVIENNFINNKSKLDKLNIKTPKISAEVILNNQNYEKTIESLGSVCKKLKDLEPDHDFIKQIYKDYENTVKYIKDEYKFRITFFGGISTGKSSMINSLIGYDLNLIPKSSDHCTKIILIIQYIDNFDNISVYKANFGNHNEYSLYSFFKQEEKIAEGKNEVIKKLNELNNNSNNSGEIPYYILKTPIEFLDDHIKDIKRRQKIELIDLPGLNSESEELENGFLNNLMGISDFFIFVNDKNVIQEENKEIISKFFLILLKEKVIFDLNSIMFVVNQIDLIGIQKKEDIYKIIQDFSEEINDIYKKIVTNDWNNYIKYKKIVKNDNKLLCTYFSKTYYLENKSKKKNFQKCFNYETLLNSIIIDYDLKESNNMLKGILRYLKKDYLNLLQNKKDYSIEKIEFDDSDLKIIFKILNNYNCSNEYINNNIKIIKEITGIYKFIKENLDNIKFNYDFKEYISALKNKILENDFSLINIIILKFIIQLNNNFIRINENLKRLETNTVIQYHETNEITEIYNKFKKEIEDKFQIEIKNLQSILQNIIYQEKNNNYYKEFEEKLNSLYLFLSDKIKIYSEKISRAKNKIIQEYSKEVIFKNDYLVKIEFSGNSEVFQSFIKNGVVYGVLLGGVCACATEGVAILQAALGGAIIGGGLGIALSIGYLVFATSKYLYNRYKENSKRKEKIKKKFKIYFDNLEERKKKALINMENIYNEAKKEIRMYRISQINPMHNIYKNNKEYEEIQKEFQDIFINFETDKIKK